MAPEMNDGRLCAFVSEYKQLILPNPFGCVKIDRPLFLFFRHLFSFFPVLPFVDESGKKDIIQTEDYLHRR